MEAQNRCMIEYNKIMDEYPVLSKKEERELIKIINKYKDGKAKYEARQALMNSNIRLVLKEALKYKTMVSIDDLMIAGCEGLWIATERFELKYKTKFSTYATPWIKLFLYRTLKNLGSMVYVPINVKNKIYKYQDLMDVDQNITDENLKVELGVSQRGLDKIRFAQYSTLSLNHPYSNYNHGDGEITLQDLLPDEKAVDPSISIQSDESKQIIYQALNDLSDIQKDILIERYLMGDKSKLSTVGKKWNISGERVRQIEFQALKKMRRRLKDKTIFELR